jgi:tryptophan synthase alpha chain
MSRIEKTFEQLRSKGEKALIPYLMAGDPYLERTEELVLTLAQSGADIIELGVPFSDPIADGPVIQRAGLRALKWKTSLRDILKLVEAIRRKTEIPLVLMTYTNPVSKFGEGHFIREAVSAGVDGVILPDLPPEEGRLFMSQAEKKGLDVILLAAPTTPRDRLEMISRLTRGFLYYVSLIGITGASLGELREVQARILGIRKLTPKPIAVGFGIETPKQAAAMARVADGVIVGSAMVRLIEEQMDRPELLKNIGGFVSDLKQAMTARSQKRAHAKPGGRP